MAVRISEKNMKTIPKEISIAQDIVRQRALADGGYALRNKGVFRPDTTAWAILAMKAWGDTSGAPQRACERLATAQMADGRVPMAAYLPEAHWPTALAMMAWADDPIWKTCLQKAANFLINVQGITFPFQGKAGQGNDSSIKGWAWVDGTYAWVVPTSLGMMALSCAGQNDHPRVGEAVRLLLDRQLPAGGWNYGNTYQFGTELLATPETTGHALTSLKGRVKRDRIEASLSYLKGNLLALQSPLSLAWAVIGLNAWLEPTIESEKLIVRSLSLQKRYGAYETDLLAMLMVAFFYDGSTNPWCREQ